MPARCSAFGCSNTSGTEKCFKAGISFHQFPLKDWRLMQQWILKIKRRNFVPNECTKICSEHFEESCFKYQLFTNRRELKRGAVPTKFCFVPVKKKKRTSDTMCKNDPDNSEGMVNSCSAYGCTERYKKGSQIGFFRFPTDVLRRFLWIKAVRRLNWLPSATSVICGKHFQTGRPTADEKHPDYVPSIFIFNKCDEGSSTFRKRMLCRIESIETVSKGSEHSADRNESSVAEEHTEVTTLFTGEQNQTGTPSLLRDTSNPDWAPSINLGHDYFENEDGRLKICHQNLQKVADNSTSCMEDVNSIIEVEEEEEEEKDDDDDDEEEEGSEDLAVINESEDEGEENVTLHKNNESGQDRLKYFIFSGSTKSNPNQACSVTHGEALNAAETLLHYMENQDNVDHADLILIRGYRQKILENMMKDS